MVCQLGVIDIAKIQVLVKNHRLNGSLLCIVISSQQIMLALFFERYIKKIILEFWLWTVIDQIANVACAYFLYDMFKTEMTEVHQIKTNDKVPK